jgi:deoxyribodipyrimidine photo-lyase
MFDTALESLAQDLKVLGGKLFVLDGKPELEIPRFLSRNAITDLWYADEIEPEGRKRDSTVRHEAERLGVTVHVCTDQYIYAPDAFVTGTGKAYSVFTPFKKRCLASLPHQPIDAPKEVRWLDVTNPFVEPDVAVAHGMFCAMQTSSAYKHFAEFCDNNIQEYDEQRNFPAVKGTSRLSPHLHFGVVSPRRLLFTALSVDGDGASTYASELIWRDFYAQVMYHRPDSLHGCFQRHWDALPWQDDPSFVSAWMEGKTGYPIVDAAMRQLNATGWMHNRLRMIVASFLTKDLLVDWRIGETYFRSKLLDGDIASNVGGWQWAASTGTDAQPWFRVFNPVAQGLKFDPSGSFVREWLPELEHVPDKYIHAPWLMSYSETMWLGFQIGHDYPYPIVDHGVQRLKALDMFKKVALTREPS